jgi:hypothetical protein
MFRRLLPIAVAAGVVATTVASCRLRFALEDIARTGSGGVGPVEHLLGSASTSLAVGVVIAIVLLIPGILRLRDDRPADWLSTLAGLGGIGFLGLVVVMLSAFYYGMLAPLGVAPPWFIPRLWSPGHGALSSVSFLLEWVSYAGVLVSLLVLVATMRNLRRA